jgi:hypothetical protein
MATLNLIITTAGQAAIAQAGSLGPVVISKVAIGSGTWSVAPTPAATALNTQIKQLDPSGSDTPSAGIIHITATDNSTDVYNVYEMGLYTSTGVLFAIAGGTTLFLTKATGSSSLFSIDLAITNVPSGSVVIGDAGFAYPPATETTQGVAEIATSAEVVAGTDDTRIVTPRKLNDANFLSKSGGTVTGTFNVTGALQVNGEVGYVLTSIYEETIPYTYTGAAYGVQNFWTSSSFTKPAGEVWVFEFSMTHAGYRGYVYEFGIRYGSQTFGTGNYLFVERFHDGSGGGAYTINNFGGRFVVQSETAITDTLRLDVGTGNAFSIGNGSLPSSGFPNATLALSKLRIYKYKTA